MTDRYFDLCACTPPTTWLSVSWNELECCRNTYHSVLLLQSNEAPWPVLLYLFLLTLVGITLKQGPPQSIVLCQPASMNSTNRQCTRLTHSYMSSDNISIGYVHKYYTAIFTNTSSISISISAMVPDDGDRALYSWWQRTDEEELRLAWWRQCDWCRCVNAVFMEDHFRQITASCKK